VKPVDLGVVQYGSVLSWGALIHPIFLRGAAVFAELGASTPFVAVFIMIFSDIASVDAHEL
jgi:hypothetical protein